MVSIAQKAQNKLKTAAIWKAAVEARTPEAVASAQQISNVVDKQEQMALNKVAPVVPVTPIQAPILDESTMTPVQPVEPVKPFISPALQAKIDAKKGITQKPRFVVWEDGQVIGNPDMTPEEAEAARIAYEKSRGYTSRPVVDEKRMLEDQANAGIQKGETMKQDFLKKQWAVEISDVEKNAQASGVKYAMQNWTPVYSPATTEEATKILQTGGKIEENSKVWAVAQANIKKVTAFSQMTDKQLWQNIVNGNVSPKDLQALSAMNPELVKWAQAFATKGQITNTANSISSDNLAISEGKEGTIDNKALDNLLNKVRELDANKETYWEMKARVYAQYPDMDAAKEEIVTAQTQLRQLQRAKRDLYADYKKKNSSLPISMIMAGYSALSRDLDNSIYEVNDTLSQNVAVYNSYLDEANAEIEWEVGDQKAQEERLFKMYGVTNEAEIRQEDIAREDRRIADEITREEENYQRDIEREDLVSARTRGQKIEDLKIDQSYNIDNGLLALGVNPQGLSTEQKYASYANAVKTKNAQDLSLEYSKLYKDGNINSNAPQFQPVVNADWSVKISENSVYSLGVNPEGSVSVQGVNVGGQAPNGRTECGAFVNDLIGSKIFGNYLPDKTKNINTNTPAVGGAFIEDVGKYGHVGFIESVNPDGSINVIDSNYSDPPDGVIRRDTISVGSDRWNQIKGFYDPSLPIPWSEQLDKTQRWQLQSAQKAAEARPEIKNWQEISGVRKWIDQSEGKDLNGSDIQGLISNYAKILDPDSVVREGEYAIAQMGASKGKADQIKQAIRTYMFGWSEVLSKEAQTVLVDALKRRISAMEGAYNDAVASEIWQAEAVIGTQISPTQLFGENNIKPSWNSFKPTTSDWTLEDDVIDNLRGSTSFINSPMKTKQNPFGTTIPWLS